jgi:hypothetical protein
MTMDPEPSASTNSQMPSVGHKEGTRENPRKMLFVLPTAQFPQPLLAPADPEGAKGAANDLFRQGRWSQAANLYSQAILVLLVTTQDMPLQLLLSMCDAARGISELSPSTVMLYQGVFAGFPYRSISGPPLERFVMLASADGRLRAALWPLLCCRMCLTCAVRSVVN